MIYSKTSFYNGSSTTYATDYKCDQQCNPIKALDITNNIQKRNEKENLAFILQGGCWSLGK